jgi:hypothetical protein
VESRQRDALIRVRSGVPLAQLPHVGAAYARMILEPLPHRAGVVRSAARTGPQRAATSFSRVAPSTQISQVVASTPSV